MENNLKTYPTDGNWMSAYKWKEAFKKELREMYERHEFSKDKVSACFCELIEEILGES